MSFRSSRTSTELTSPTQQIGTFHTRPQWVSTRHSRGGDSADRRLSGRIHVAISDSPILRRLFLSRAHHCHRSNRSHRCSLAEQKVDPAMREPLATTPHHRCRPDSAAVRGGGVRDAPVHPRWLPDGPTHARQAALLLHHDSRSLRSL
ncbi:hypothetical protein ANCCEY_09396 [Ancylostoma ceylanicum]|uniref:Uncharacterized protein n=1 Tax=Ancylostoma ceylanicum TaxID=53326 RepID=A0A0D6LV28_9BILA|nr:hypothetical protein ANCCEY_09396 [Ancylostoma ceylanicum]